MIVTVATDGAAMYGTETDKAVHAQFGGTFDAVNAGEVWAGEVKRMATDHLLELTHIDRNRIYNLGYFTWVEQQGVAIEDFDGAPRSVLLGRASRPDPGLGRDDRGIQRGVPAPPCRL